MLRVLQLNVTANWGSTGKIAEGISVAAMNRGWEAAIAYGRMANPSVTHLIKASNKADVYSHYAMSRLFDAEGWGSRRATHKLLGQIEEYKPDIIHLHNIHDHWLNYPSLFRWLAKQDIPVVWTMHDCWPFTGGCFHFVGNNCMKWAEGDCSLCPQRRGRIDHTSRHFALKKELYEDLAGRLTIVSVSKWLDGVVGQSILGVNPHMAIYNGIDTNTFRPMPTADIDVQYGLTGKTVIAGVSNVWSDSKGLNHFIALRKELSDKYAIVLIGLNEKQIAGLPKGIIGIPRTHNVEELAKFYSRSDMVLSLSKGETFGLTIAEGMACGTPAIGFGTTSIPEIISEETGVVIPYGDIEALTQTVTDIGERRITFSAEQCRNRALTNFDKTTQFNKYVDLYDQILGFEKI